MYCSTVKNKFRIFDINLFYIKEICTLLRAEHAPRYGCIRRSGLPGGPGSPEASVGGIPRQEPQASDIG